MDTDLTGPESSSFKIEVGDIRDWPRLVSVMKDAAVTIVMHLAAVLAASETNLFQAVKTNVDGTVGVLEASRLVGCRRFIFTSTRDVLAPTDEDDTRTAGAAIDENFPFGPLSAYGATKLAAEVLCEMYGRTYDMDLVGLRFPAMYGPGRQSRHGGYAALSDLIESASEGRIPRLPIDLSQRDDVIFIGDAARALAMVAEAPQLSQRIYHISSGVLTRPSDFASVLHEYFPNWEIARDDTEDRGKKATSRSLRKFEDALAERDFGYTPVYDLRHGIDAHLTVLSGTELPLTLVTKEWIAGSSQAVTK